MAQLSPLRRRMIEDMTVRNMSPAAILRQRGPEVQPIFRQVARAAEPGRRSRFSGSPGLHAHLVAQSQPDRLRLAVLLWCHAGRG
jgi:hypothetical protein